MTMNKLNKLNHLIYYFYLHVLIQIIKNRKKLQMSNQQNLHRYRPTHFENLATIQINLPSTKPNNNKFDLDPPRQISQKQYSLDADMINGWKPRKITNSNANVVFPLNFSNQLVDSIYKTLLSKQKKQKNPLYKIVYVGDRPANSYLLHEGKKYANPYPPQKKRQAYLLGKYKANCDKKYKNNIISFDSNFESGNLDLAVQVSETQYDLFMRIDSNTKGHTNWFYFKIINKDYTGCIKFNICNFTRPKSLYQRGLRPYGQSKYQNSGWKQVGLNLSYTRQKLRYDFMNDEQEDRFSKYFTLSFTYDFKFMNDTTSFAYCIPYTYTDLNNLLSKLSNCKKSQLTKSLAGLNVPLIQITDPTIEEGNKQAILLTARTHPGQSNSSFIMEGFLKFVCSNDTIAVQLRKKVFFYVIPMLNPDGVVSGNYRTSCFGKDLNRTFDQHRQYAFPQTYYLLELVKKLKVTHKNSFLTYLDFHGHSVKKNAFTYGPGFQVSNPNYFLCREFPKILSTLTPIFRYYSCQFKITFEKSSTSRAVLNRRFNIPFTYTLQSSTHGYYDMQLHKQQQFTSIKWVIFGYQIAKTVNQFIFVQKRYNPSKKQKKYFSNSKNNQQQQHDKQLQKIELQRQMLQQQKKSDDNISQGKSDSQAQQQDLPDEQLKALQMHLQGTKKLELQTIEEKNKILSRCKTEKQYSPNSLEKLNKKNSSISHRKINFDHVLRKHDYKTCSHRRCRLRFEQEQKKLQNLSQNPQQFLPSIFLKNRQPFFLRIDSTKNNNEIVRQKQFNLQLQKCNSHKLSYNRAVLKMRSELFSLDSKESPLSIKKNKVHEKLKNRIQVSNRF